MASGGSYSIRITAVDAASKQIEQINKRLAALHAPAQRLNKSIAKFARVSGIKRLTEGFGKMRNAALDSVRGVGSLITPLSALTGAASLAGMAGLASRAADFANHLTIAATRLGMTTTNLYNMNNAGRMMGDTADGMGKSLQNLGDRAHNALFGRDQQFLTASTQLGIKFNTKTKPEDIMRQLFGKIHERKNDPATVRYIQSLFGLSDAQVAAAMKGGVEAFDKAQKEAEKYGYNSDAATKSATDFYHAQTELNETIGGFGNLIGEKLFPMLTPIVQAMADWVVKNRDWIATDIGADVKLFIDYCKQLWPEIKHGWTVVNDIVEKFGGWKTVIGAIVAIEFAGWVAKIVTSLNPLSLALLAMVSLFEKIETFSQKGHGGDPSTWKADSPFWQGMSAKEQSNYANSPKSQAFLKQQGQADDNPNPYKWYNPGSWLGHNRKEQQQPQPPPADKQGAIKQAQKYFLSQGWTPQQTAGILANVNAESKFNAKAVGDNGAAYGIGQWHPDRQDQFKKLFGHDIRQGSYQEQLQFENWELHNTEKRAGDALAKTTTPEQAGAVVSKLYERPAGGVTEAMVRGSSAPEFVPIAAPSAPPVPTPSAPAVQVAKVPPVQVAGQLGATINVTGNTQGVTTTASSSGAVATPNVRYAMAGPT